MSIKVTVLNPDEVKTLFVHWGNFSRVCYDTQGVNPENIGKHCFKSGHFSGSRTRYIELEISGVSRAIVDQLVRHEQGVVKNVQSTRYVDKFNFEYDIPEEIQSNEQLVGEYIEYMGYSRNIYAEIQDYILEKTGSKERANEQARTVLPMGIHSSVTIGMTLEALIHYMNMRLCARAEKEHRELAIAIRNAVLKILPDLTNDLVPQCERLMYCPEFKSCGAYPKKEEVQKYVQNMMKGGK